MIHNLKQTANRDLRWTDLQTGTWADLEAAKTDTEMETERGWGGGG